jgi:hypothetical protein
MLWYGASKGRSQVDTRYVEVMVGDALENYRQARLRLREGFAC